MTEPQHPTIGNERTPLLTHTLVQGQIYTATDGSASATGVATGADEEAGNEPSPTSTESNTISIECPSKGAIIRLILILLIGVFVSNMDGSILLATHSVISSEFNALSSSSWLLTSYALAMASIQTLWGKLSDIYGRKSTLIVAHALFGIGCGLGRTFAEVIAGRVVSGIGGAGLTALVSILITDLVPAREVASWRGYLNISATAGRSLGGPIGGYLADTIGWRWSLTGQAPLMGIAMLLCWAYLPRQSHENRPLKIEEDNRTKLARIDFLGATLMATMVLAFLFPIELGGVVYPWTDARILVMFGSSIILALLFIIVETYWVKEPIFPLDLLSQKDVVLSYLVMLLLSAAQLGMMFTVPLYFQITAKTSFTTAGAHLFPAVAGNAMGGLLAGYIIHRTGRYKGLIIFGSICSAVSYLLLIIRWNGSTGWLESLYIIPSGMGIGICQIALFTSITAAILPSQIAIAGSGMFMYSTIGMVLGLAASSAVEQEVLRRALETRLLRLGIEPTEMSKIIQRAVSDLQYVGALRGKLAEAVVSSYIVALDAAHALSFGCSVVCIVSGLLFTARKL